MTPKLQKKDPKSILPGFEVYAELKPIVPFWQWLLAGLFAMVSSSSYVYFDFSLEFWPIIILVFVVLSLAFLFALFYRGKSFPVGIKREGSTVLMAGRFLSESLNNSSKIEFQNPAAVYLEKRGGRMQLSKMMIRFFSPEDARRVVDWLQRPWPAVPSPERTLDPSGEIWALVYAGEYIRRSRIQFERDVCYVVDPGRNIFDVKPKKLERRDEVTLVANTGFWNLGTVTMKFDSSSDADKIEQRLKDQLKRGPV